MYIALTICSRNIIFPQLYQYKKIVFIYFTLKGLYGAEVKYDIILFIAIILKK